MTSGKKAELKLTYVGGPTVLVELCGLRMLTDPTFDAAGTSYPTKVYRLKKLSDPALRLEDLGRIDIVLLSHDHHFDNLDNKGRTLLARAGQVPTTSAGAERLGGFATGLSPWQSLEMTTPSMDRLRITGTPARHGPAAGDRGPVTGFFIQSAKHPEGGVYISGDTVWYEGMEEVSRRLPVKVALLFMGAAVVSQVGPSHLTMTAQEGVLAARTFAEAQIVPLHFEGWEHFSQSRQEIQNAFEQAGLAERLIWLPPGDSQIVLC